MTPEQFAKYTPLLVGWIQQTLDAAAPGATPISQSGFQCLARYFSDATLQSSKAVVVDKLPLPPLSQMGLAQFEEFERGDFAAITYLDTFFVRRHFQTKSLYFHEMIHVIQWRLLGPEKFLGAYAIGLEQFGYRNSPLEAMAYDAQAIFDGSNIPFDAEKLVGEKLAGII